MKPLFKKLLAIGRGALKGAFPGVSGAIEAAKNIKGVETTVTTPSGETVTGIAKPHSWYSIIASLAVSALVIYGIISGKITEEAAINILKFFF